MFDIRRMHITPYEYIYYFMMVIYMSYMTTETRVMCGGMTSNPIAFSIPLFLTLILVIQKKLSFYDRNLIISLIVFLIWSFIQIYTKRQYDFHDIANYLYILYALIVAYIHVKVFGEKLFLLYEDVILKLSLLSLIIWLFTCLLPDIAMMVAKMFPETSHGHNLLYLVNWIRTDDLQHVTYGLIRNSGCSWEPGRFAIMVCLAFMISLYYKGLSLKNNKHILVYLVTILTTMSTTGYILFIVIYAYMFMKSFRPTRILKILIILIPLAYSASQLEFIGEKLKEKLDVNESVEHIEESYQWTENNNENGENVAYAMDRFPSLYFEGLNFINDPIIGYGGNLKDSFFVKNYTDAIGFTGGLMTLFARHGIFLAFFLLYVLYTSSIAFAKELNSKKKYGILICFLVSMISYPLIWFPLYTAFWFYGFFYSDLSDKNEKCCNTVNCV